MATVYLPEKVFAMIRNRDGKLVVQKFHLLAVEKSKLYSFKVKISVCNTVTIVDDGNGTVIEEPIQSLKVEQLCKRCFAGLIVKDE